MDHHGMEARDHGLHSIFSLSMESEFADLSLKDPRQHNGFSEGSSSQNFPAPIKSPMHRIPRKSLPNTCRGTTASPHRPAYSAVYHLDEDQQGEHFEIPETQKDLPGSELGSVQSIHSFHQNSLEFRPSNHPLPLVPRPLPSPESSILWQHPQTSGPLTPSMSLPTSQNSSRRASPRRQPAWERDTYICTQDGAQSPSSRRVSMDKSGTLPSKDTKETRETKEKKRKSWFHTRKSVATQQSAWDTNATSSFVLAPNAQIPYDLTPLLNFQKVPELWDPEGDTIVYLHDRTTDLGPSFRVHSSCFSSSIVLTQAAFGEISDLANIDIDMQPQSRARSRSQERSTLPAHRYDSSGNNGVSPALDPVNGVNTSSRPWHGSRSSSSTSLRHVSDYQYRDDAQTTDIHLCIPQQLRARLEDIQWQCQTSGTYFDAEDVDILVTVRNFFAFLTGQPLAATSKQRDIFEIIMHLSQWLHRYEFTNMDGSSLGEVVDARFAEMTRDFGLADVRHSRSKTVEAIVLGERMRSWPLYNEGFAHAVGQYPQILALKSPKMHQMHEITRNRLARGHLFLSTRLRSVAIRLECFDFPSMFAGALTDTKTGGAEERAYSVKNWRTAFQCMRRHTLSFYKNKYGTWPPKAQSKQPKKSHENENGIEGSGSGSGLHRLVLQEIYNDMCNLYDVLVDRGNFTTRRVDLPIVEEPELPFGKGSASGEEARKMIAQHAMRKALHAYDRSAPPNQPPVPYDLPTLPSLSSVRRDFEHLDDHKRHKLAGRRLKDPEINMALMQSYNRSALRSTEFTEAFFIYERRCAHGHSIDELGDIRYGQWAFIYAVIQSLPLVIVDAPGLQHTEGVSYFLSEFCKESPPWLKQDARQKRTTWRIPGSETMVDMPAAAIEHSIDAIYQRSHCWQVAREWSTTLNSDTDREAIASSMGHDMSAVKPYASEVTNTAPSSASCSWEWETASGTGTAAMSSALSSASLRQWGDSVGHAGDRARALTPTHTNLQDKRWKCSLGNGHGMGSSMSLPAMTNDLHSQQLHQPHHSEYDLIPPPRTLMAALDNDIGGSRRSSVCSGSDRSIRDRRSSILGPGLEQLPMPMSMPIGLGESAAQSSRRSTLAQGMNGSTDHNRPHSSYDPTKSFDAILGLGSHSPKPSKQSKHPKHPKDSKHSPTRAEKEGKMGKEKRKSAMMQIFG